MTMDAETARQERIMGIRHIVRQQKEIIEAKRKLAASRQRGRYHHLQTYAVCVRCGENYAIPGQTLCVDARCTITRCAAVRSKRRGGKAC